MFDKQKFPIVFERKNKLEELASILSDNMLYHLANESVAQEMFTDFWEDNLDREQVLCR